VSKVGGGGLYSHVRSDAVVGGRRGGRSGSQLDDDWQRTLVVGETQDCDQISDQAVYNNEVDFIASSVECDGLDSVGDAQDHTDSASHQLDAFSSPTVSMDVDLDGALHCDSSLDPWRFYDFAPTPALGSDCELLVGCGLDSPQSSYFDDDSLALDAPLDYDDYLTADPSVSDGDQQQQYKSCVSQVLPAASPGPGQGEAETDGEGPWRSIGAGFVDAGLWSFCDSLVDEPKYTSSCQKQEQHEQPVLPQQPSFSTHLHPHISLRTPEHGHVVFPAATAATEDLCGPSANPTSH